MRAPWETTRGHIPRARGRESVLESLLEGVAGLEGRALGGGDVDSLTGHGVAALPGGALTDLETAEADDLDLVAALEGVNDGIESGVDGRVRVLLGEISLCGNFIDKLSLVHYDILRIKSF